MGQLTISKVFRVDGVLVNPSSMKLSDATGTYGVRRTDTGAVVVADGTDLVQSSTGRFYYTFTEPAAGLTYEYVVEIVYGGETYRFTGTVAGGAAAGTDLYDYATWCIPYAGPCPVEVIKQALRRTARDFFTETEVWGEDLAAIPSVANQAAYALTHAYAADILRVPAITVDGTITEWSYRVNAAASTLTLSPAPPAANLAIVPAVVFKPREHCSSYPGWLLSRWGLEITDGVLAHLKSMRASPWYDPDGAVRFELAYRRHVNEAKRETITQRAHGSVKVRLRPFV